MMVMSTEHSPVPKSMLGTRPCPEGHVVGVRGAETVNMALLLHRHQSRRFHLSPQCGWSSSLVGSRQHRKLCWEASSSEEKLDSGTLPRSARNVCGARPAPGAQ